MSAGPKSGLRKPKNGSMLSRMALNMHDYVVSRLEAAKGRWPQIAEASGVSKRTIEKIARREIDDPGVSHIQKLSDYFRAAEGSGRAP